MINVTNGKLLRLLVDDEPFDVRYGELRSHERVLDLRAGTLTPHGRVGLAGGPGGAGDVDAAGVAHPAVGGRHQLRGRGPRRPGADRRAVRAGGQRVAARPLRRPPGGGRAWTRPSSPRTTPPTATRVILVHRTQEQPDAAWRPAWTTSSTARTALGVESESFPDIGRVSVTTVLEPGQRLRIVKFVAYGWSGLRSVPALRDQVAAALLAARQTGWDGLLAEQRAYLDDFWDRGRRRARRRPRRAAGGALRPVPRPPGRARAERRAIPAKGLTGPGYDGHAFWDTEIFVLPVLTYTVPAGGGRRPALAPRHARPGRASGPAQLGLKGAAFPWRTIAGEECSAYWPAGTAAFHINADIADAVDPLRGRHRRRGLRAGPSGSSCWSRRRGCGARSATTTSGAASASTA